MPPAAGRELGDRIREALAANSNRPAEIVFAQRVGGTDHWYVNFGRYACPTIEYPANQRGESACPPGFKSGGGRLCVLDVRTGKVRVLLEDADGSIRDPAVDYDGRTIFFSWRKGGGERFHLYRIQADGSSLRQITDGAGDDIEPAVLPDGALVFVSSRCNRFVNCWRSPVAILYRCERDGSGMRMLSSSIEHDNTPWVLQDGRILYMRWEYVDRSQLLFHHLWTVNPDGSGQMVYYGNMNPGGAMLDAKAIPGGDRVVASFSPGHGRGEHAGSPMLIDPGAGPDDPARSRTFLPPVYRDPYPLGGGLFLAATGKRLVAFDGTGQVHTLWEPPADETLATHEPRPLWGRPREPVLAPRTKTASSTGRLLLQDVRLGRNMDGVAPGEIVKLLVLEQLPKPINFSGGPYPISNGGTFTLARVLGTVPVHPDGSAYFEVPALRSVFFVALDRRDRAVKRMHSFVTVQPGETLGCVGCHESRTQAPVMQDRPAATATGPARIQPFEDLPGVFDFPRDVQPVLTRHCASCHNGQKYEGRVDLSGDQTPVFNAAYNEMIQHSLFTDGRNESGNSLPRSVGSGNSRILDMVDGQHYKVRLSEREKTVLRLWIDSSAPFAGTYAALGSGMHVPALPAEAVERRCGSCHAPQPASAPGQAAAKPAPAKKPAPPKEKLYRFGSQGLFRILARNVQDLPKERAGHGRPAGFGYMKFGEARSAHECCNLSRPPLSLLLRAPLAKAAGGLGICGEGVFASREDPDYRAMLAAIEEAAARRRQEKRFDMPGFVPNVYYLARMQEYRILPADADLDAAVNPYELDRQYWESFWYRPGE
ncbi:MAG: translocation protein TolB [Planctomycetes bacterium ADurb.Bin126]|mgnify:CR=1 FL=1|nr:MAG: translocation protein TolB [Planctomycetes bacterium ADurb.Bin126]